MKRSSVEHKILLVDDNVITLHVLADILQENNTLLLSESGAQALVLAYEHLPSLILLDILMPEMDGYEVLRRLKMDARTKNIPVIFISALDGLSDVENGLMLGALDYISKPFSPTIIRARVGNHLLMVEQQFLLARTNAIDPESGAGNVLTVQQSLSREWRRACRDGGKLSLAMIRVDQLDEPPLKLEDAPPLLPLIVQSLTQALNRPGDYLARYSGNTFVLVLPHTDEQGASTVAQHLQDVIEARQLNNCYSLWGPKVSVSIAGVSCQPQREVDPGLLLHEAQLALQQARAKGPGSFVWQEITLS